MDRLHRRSAVMAVVAVASLGAAACGSSSSSKTTAKSPPTPSTPSTTTTTAAAGPLTKDKVLALAKPVQSAQSKFSAALTSGNPQAVAAAASTLATALDSYASQVGALKAPSAAAATAQQKYVSLSKQYAAVMGQVSKAASANDQSALQELSAKQRTVAHQTKAAEAQLAATLP